ncbi:hypothetical protein ES707_20386 [subsurface metagenome]
MTIVGVGGAGGIAAIILARSGLANFNLIDFDVYSLSNINRQIGCFVDTLGKYKSEVIKQEILRINPKAKVTAYTRRLPLKELEELIDDSDVYLSEADDLAYSSYSLIMAQERGKFAITYMPSGLTGYIMVFPPDLPHIIDPTNVFGGSKGLSYEELYQFLADPELRGGRRWHIMQGKMRIEWFKKWCLGETTLTQLCPSVWAGASLACIEVLKYLTGKWKTVKAPKMWQLELGDNRIRVAKFRRRTWLFCKFIYWAFNIKWLGIGERVRRYTAGALKKDLDNMERQQKEGKEAKPPFMWRYII